MSDPVISFYEEMPFPNNPQIIPAIAKIFGRVKQDHVRSILVVGCGTGEDLVAARMVYPNAVIHGLEPSKMSCQLAYELAPFARITNNTLEEAVVDREYDLVICTGVLHHLKNPTTALAKLTQFMRPDGALLLGVYHHMHWDFDTSNLNPTNLRDYAEHPRAVTFSWHGLYRLAEAHGLRLCENSHRLPRWYNRYTRSLYDGLFSFTGQSMMYVVLR